MTHFIKNIFIFLIGILGIFYSLNLFQSKFNIDPEHYKEQYFSATNTTSNTDGIILGTSHATHSIRPTILDESGITFYNYALNGANPEFYYKWYNDIYLSYNDKPSYCLFAVDFFMFDENWLWRRFEQDSEYLPDEVFLKELFQNKESDKIDLIVNRFAATKYRSQIVSSLMLKHGSVYHNIKNYDRGYISDSIPFDSIRFKSNLTFKIDESQIKYFKKLLHQMVESNVEIIFTMTPEYKIDVDEYDKMESLKIIKQIAKGFNIPILNYNMEFRSDINQNILLFSDWGHLNHKGAGVFSKKIADDLKMQNAQ